MMVIIIYSLKILKYKQFQQTNILTGEDSKYRSTLEREEMPIKFLSCPFIIILYLL